MGRPGRLLGISGKSRDDGAVRAAALLTVLILSCGPAFPQRASRSTEVGEQDAPATDQALERTIFSLVNRRRVDRGLRALVLDPEISRVARRHSAAMAAHEYPLGHEGFDDRAHSLLRATRARRTAENVAVNHGYRNPAAEAVRGWIASPGHRVNLEGPYEITGIGVARNATGELYFTQIFVGR